MNFYGIGDIVDVRFKDVAGGITWIPGKITNIGSQIEIYLEDNPFRFTKVYVETERIRKHEEEER